MTHPNLGGVAWVFQSSKSIARLHGGTVEIASQGGRGTKVTLTLASGFDCDSRLRHRLLRL